MCKRSDPAQIADCPARHSDLDANVFERIDALDHLDGHFHRWFISSTKRERPTIFGDRNTKIRNLARVSSLTAPIWLL